MALLGQYYYDGTSFGLATHLYTDASLTTAAPNGWYSQGGIVRQVVSGGVLLATQTCTSCIYACDSQAIDATLFGHYTLTVDVGTSTGPVLAEFFVESPMMAAKCTWEYNGVTASEYSSPNKGYCEGLLGDENIGGIDNLTGSGTTNYTGTNYVNSGNTFAPGGGVITWGPYANQAAGGVTLYPGGNFGTSIMVIPKNTIAVTTITFKIDMPTPPYSNGWSLKVNCPANALSPVPLANYSNVDCPTACASTLPTPLSYYIASVNSIPNPLGNIIPALYDWLYVDYIGSSAAADGYYTWVDSATSTVKCLKVNDGVINSITNC